MRGAIYGDIIGSKYEFNRGNKTKDFVLFTSRDEFTDDTVMTVAIAEALMSVSDKEPDEIILDVIRKSIQKWGHKYPNAGYGARFYAWLNSGDEAKAYNSFGNGSAMRVSAAGWLYDSLELTRRMAKLTAEVTHNHPEGIKGAEATASIIYMARHGADKASIKKYVIDEFGYDLSRSLDDIRPGYYHVEDCMRTVPEAITAFLEGNSYEDVIRNAVSLGGDTDTLGAIAGAMAEAMYGIPEEIRLQGDTYLNKEFVSVINQFYGRIG